MKIINTEPTPQNHFLKELVDKAIYNETLHDQCVREQEQEQAVEYGSQSSSLNCFGFNN